MNVARFFAAAALCTLALQPLHAEESTADVIKALGLTEKEFDKQFRGESSAVIKVTTTA